MRRAVWRALDGAGVFHLGRHFHRHRVVVLTYHKILPDRLRGVYDRRPETVLFASEFAAQVQYLAGHYRILTGDEFRAGLADPATLPPHALLITFDDGFANNRSEALPILQRFSAHAVFFVATDFVEQRIPRLWFDRLDAALAARPERALEEWLSARQPDTPSRAAFRSAMKRMPAGPRDALIAELEHDAASGGHARLQHDVAGPMTWPQVRELAAAGMTIGSHTVTHQILATTDARSVDRELIDSRRAFEARTDCACWSFSYPNGELDDFRDDDRAAVRRAGYECAFTQIRGFVGRDDDRFALRRMPVPASSELSVLRSRVSGIHGLLTRS
jgi:peptidoglycan/xylan/chitin deacetylase (PgdA/CDA1 family)